jgi:hypothetical protein
MSLRYLGTLQLSIELQPAFRRPKGGELQPDAVATPELGEFMRKVCDMVDDHPEWIHQNQPERMKNFMAAVREL